MKPLAALLLFIGTALNAQQPKPFGPVPSEAQMRWHEMEMNAFIHFTTNTFTDREWGNGDEPESVFNPTDLDVDQWTKTLRDAGFRMAILTCKHHDGFCLWPSKYTSHTVKSSPYKKGEGDIVKELSASCKRNGLSFGVYLSPWDRNRADYGQPSYLDYYRNQLKELFTNYGKVTEMWFDGANGGTGYYGGARELRKIDGSTYYEWPTTLAIGRKIQPEVLYFSDAGPDIRWVGNESGIGGTTNWNTISPDTLYAGKSGINSLLGTGSPDGNHWIPAEVNTSIRPGWFSHAAEDSLVKSPQKLFETYLQSVGRGSTLLLNIPPDRRGRFHENDVASLQGLRKILDSVFAVNLALKATASASDVRGKQSAYSPSKLVDGKPATFWCTDDAVTTPTIELKWKTPQTIHYVLLQEYIRLGQRISSFIVESEENGKWKEIATGTTVGYKRILQVPVTTTRHIRVKITQSKACPVMNEIAVF